jgi:hypothetical protein
VTQQHVSGNIERWRESMLRPDDEPRWTIDGQTMRASGPWLKAAGRIEVVPASVLEGAIDRIAELEAERQAVLDAVNLYGDETLGCDDFFHDDDGSVCRHIKAPALPEALYVEDVLGDIDDQLGTDGAPSHEETSQ